MAVSKINNSLSPISVSLKAGNTVQIPIDGNRLIATGHQSSAGYRSIALLTSGLIIPVLIPSTVYLEFTYENGVLTIQNNSAGGTAGILIL